MGTFTLALLCASAAILVYDRMEARSSMRNGLDVLAEMWAPIAPGAEL